METKNRNNNSNVPPSPPVKMGREGAGDEKPDIYYVAVMLKAAQEEGMIIEVTTSFGDYRSSGDNVKVAATMALYDWDVPIPFI